MRVLSLVLFAALVAGALAAAPAGAPPAGGLKAKNQGTCEKWNGALALYCEAPGGRTGFMCKGASG